MIKQVYQTPLTDLYEIKLEGALLTSSQKNVETMRSLSGTWDEDED